MEKYLTPKKTTTGEAAVEGLFAGIAGGLMMMLVLVVFGLIRGDSPAATLSLFDPRQGGSALTGALTHLAVSAIYGALFVIIVRLFSRRWPAVWRLAWLSGAIYGIAIWLLAEVIFLPAAGSPLLSIPAQLFAGAHVVYGLCLGVASARLLSRSG